MTNKITPENTASPPRLAVVTCAVLEEEIRHFVGGLDHVVHVEVVPQGLHDDPPKLRLELQAAVDRVEASTNAQAIVLGYGLCSRGIENVITRRCQLVVVRAHDCVTLLLGDKDRYAQYASEHPGTYWYSKGWNRHALMPGKERYDKLLKQYQQAYGEDNAEFLMESEQHWFKTYNRAVFVDLTVGSTDDEVAYTKKCADWLKWDYDYQKGNPDLLKALLTGRWDEERFLVLEPGQTVRMTADARVIEACPAPGSAPGKSV